MQSEWKTVKRAKTPANIRTLMDRRNVAEWLLLDIQAQMLIGC